MGKLRDISKSKIIAKVVNERFPGDERLATYEDFAQLRRIVKKALEKKASSRKE